MDDLKNLVKNKTVAIVGPSPHLVNTGLGEFIDSHDLVIRINEILPSGYFQDYGSKTDIVFLNLGNDWLEITIEMINKDIKALDDIKLFVNPRNSLDVSTKNRFKNFWRRKGFRLHNRIRYFTRYKIKFFRKSKSNKL